MMHNSNDDSEWEVRPNGTQDQRSDEAGSDLLQDLSGDSSPGFGPEIRINVSYESSKYELPVSSNATFGDLKKALRQKTGLEAGEMRLLFRGHEKEDIEQLYNAGVKDSSTITLVADHKAREQRQEVTEEVAKAMAAITAVREEVDKLSERVVALQSVVNGGTKVAVQEFDMSAELLMRQLLKLDCIEAEGEARVQRKAEVRRIQNLHDILDNLKAQNSNLSGEI